jgi:hypothetical protein
MSIVKNICLKPILNKSPGKKPLTGNFGGGKPFIIDEGIDHLVIDMEELRNFFSGEKLFFMDAVHLCSFPFGNMSNRETKYSKPQFLSIVSKGKHQ